MKCQHCKEKEANTHFRSNVNGDIKEMYLCDTCAKDLGVMDEFKFDRASLFDDLFKSSLVGVDRCPYCGTTLDDIIQDGVVGCAYCYDKFYDRINRILEKQKVKPKHIGKLVLLDQPQPENVSKEATLENLSAQLRLAIKTQNYELAATIRDEMNKLNQED